MKLSVFLTLMLGAAIAGADTLQPFASDGCSAFPDGTFEQNELWLECCRAHDLAYWKGGTYAERLQADKTLKLCVAGVGEPEIARLMLAGVRVGGSPFWPTSFRWGYGWSYPRFYGPLTDDEKKQVRVLAAEYQGRPPAAPRVRPSPAPATPSAALREFQVFPAH